MATGLHASQSPSAIPASGRRWNGQRIAGWLIAGIVVLGLAAVFRYAVVEPREMGFACSETPQPWWCSPREYIIQAHLKNVWGIVAAVSGALALLLRQNWATPIAIVAGLAGIVLYDTSLASLGFLLGFLRLLRS